MNQVYNNPLIIRNVKFKEYLTEEESLKKINEFKFSDAGQALPDNKRNCLKRIANYFVTHPNFDEVSEDHVLIREGYPVIFTSKNYKKLKYEKPVRKEEIGEGSGSNRNNQLLGDDGGENDKSDLLEKSNTSKPKLRIRDILLAKGIEPETYAPDEDGKMKLVAQESSTNKSKIITTKKKVSKNQSNIIKHDTNDINKDHEDRNESNKVVISSKKKKKKKKPINEESNAIIENDTQTIDLIQEVNLGIGPSKKSGFSDVEGSGVKKNEDTKKSVLIKDNSSVKKVRSDSIKGKKSENEAIRTSEKRRISQESDKINVKKAKFDLSKNSIIEEESNDIGEHRLTQGTPKVIHDMGLIQGTAKVKSDPSKKKRKKKSKESEESNIINPKTIQGISSEDMISKVKNSKKNSSKKSRLKEDPSKETIDKDSSTNTGNTGSAVTINMKKMKKKRK